jgi:predicted O-linked N-acetylglucosamine transferase (SPINDLY family)
MRDFDALLEKATHARRAGNEATLEECLGRAKALVASDRSRPAKQGSFAIARFLLEANRVDEATEVVQRSLTKWPHDTVLLNLKGVLLKRKGLLGEAIQAFQQACNADPRQAAALFNLGNSYLAIGDPTKAAVIFVKVIAREPKNSEAHRLYGQALQQLGNVEKAETSFRAALSVSSQNISAALRLASLLDGLGRYSEGIGILDEAIAKNGETTELVRAKAILLRHWGRIDQSINYLVDLISRQPNAAWAHHLLGRELTTDREKANVYLRRAYELDPSNPLYLADLAENFNRSRYDDEGAHIQSAYELARKFLEEGREIKLYSKTLREIFLRCGDFATVETLGDFDELGEFWARKQDHTALHLHLGRVTSPEQRRQLIRHHRLWGESVEKNAARSPLRHVNRRVGVRAKFRVGFMSSDLRNHPVSYFVLPLLEGYDRSRFEFYCYSFYTGEEDAVQKRIRERVDMFRLAPGVSARQAAQIMADDNLDIAFELGGSTYMNKLEAMAWKPAPLQVSWLGYPHSSGLTTIDGILVDPYLKPPDPALLIEKPFELPHSWVTLGPLSFRFGLPIDQSLPEERNHRFTFGTMNNPYKYTPEMLATWADIVSRVEGSRFLFVRPEGGTPAFRESMQRIFEQHGVARERVEFIAVRGSHLQYYNEIDLSLDTFPQTGGTTTCECLWMGVPVVTLVGEAFFERLSYSNLCNAGLAELCTFDRDSYIDTAIRLAADKPRRTTLRFGLRDQIRAHPLGCTDLFVSDFQAVTEQAIRQGLG